MICYSHNVIVELMYQLLPETATMRQMIKIGENEANFDEKEWSVLLKFQTALKISTLATSMIVTEILFLCGIITNRIDS